MFIQIEEENFLKAHREGCSDVKKVLENLKPELFERKLPCLAKIIMCSDKGTILLVDEEGIGSVIKPAGSGYAIGEKYTYDFRKRPEYWEPIKGVKEDV